MNICIIGGGASGTLLLYTLLSEVNFQEISNIYIFDKDNFSGGLAYGTGCNSHILNMHSTLMSGKINDNYNFINWLKTNYRIPVVNYDYSPRQVYREYLNNLLKEAFKINQKVNVHMFHDEVLNILKKNNNYIVSTNSVTLEVNYCILCTGYGVYRDIYNLNNNLGYYNNPYKCIDGDITQNSVGIIGAGLVAIDKIIELNGMHDSVAISCVSRSGLFPGVQSFCNDDTVISFKVAMSDFIYKKKKILANELFNTINGLLKVYCGLEILVDSGYKSSEVCQLLSNEINNTINAKPNIYNYLTSIASVMPDAWNKMDLKQKKIFQQKYLSAWMRHRHSIPLKNAIQLVNMMHSGKLNLHSLNGQINFADKMFVLPTKHGNDIKTKYLINCTGSVEPFSNKLLNNLLDNGILSKHDYYGVNCNFTHNNVIDKNGEQHDKLFVIGDITKGVHFYVSGIDHILDKVRIISNSICKRVS